MTCSANSMTE